jgi:hypothetical protein
MSNSSSMPLQNQFSTLTGRSTVLSQFELSDITDDYLGWLNDPVIITAVRLNE